MLVPWSTSPHLPFVTSLDLPVPDPAPKSLSARPGCIHLKLRRIYLNEHKSETQNQTIFFCRMRALVFLTMQMALLSAAQPNTNQQESEEEHLGGSKSLSRQTRESHHLSQRPSPDPVHRLTRSRGPASPRPSRAFR